MAPINFQMAIPDAARESLRLATKVHNRQLLAQTPPQAPLSIREFLEERFRIQVLKPLRKVADRHSEIADTLADDPEPAE